MTFGTIRREDNSMLGPQELLIPSQLSSASQEEIDDYLSLRYLGTPSGRSFRNYASHFLLDWAEIDIPEPLYMRRDLDLCLRAFPEVQSPYKFPEKFYTYNSEVAEQSGLSPYIVIKPPLYDDNLNLTNIEVESRIIRSGFRTLEPSSGDYVPYGMPSGSFIPQGHHGVRVYTSNSGLDYIPIKAKRPGNIYNQPTGLKLMCAPKSWLYEDCQNSVYGPDYSSYLDELGIDLSNEPYDDEFWSWYKWQDGADEYRKQWYERIQSRFMPRRGEGFSTLLSDVKGLTQGGNFNKSWIDPIFLDSVSKVNHGRMLREVSHCYRVDKCNFASGLVSDKQSACVMLNIDKGFCKNEYAQESDGSFYCRYRQQEPGAQWKSRHNGQFGDWDNFCKYVGIPQRAIEFDGNYKTLLNDILFKFRTHGIYYWYGYTGENHPCEVVAVSNGYKLVSTEVLSSVSGKYVFGQLNFQEGVSGAGEEKDIPSGTPLFFFTVSPPSETPSGPDSSAYPEEFNNHKNCKVFAYLWQKTPDGLEKWLVELKDDYVSPAWRISEFEIAIEINNGENPFARDKRTTGKNNGGLRPYLIQDEESGEWIVAPDLFDINSNGFFNIDGGQIQIGGASADQNEIGIANSTPQFLEVPSCLASGWVKAVGLPGEVITRDCVFWTPPTVLKWDHLLELHDRLTNPTQQATEYADALINTESGKEVVPTPNHILEGDIEYGVRGTGMVSEGTTKYSDIILLSDILHARNMAMPMLACKLSSHVPDDVPEDWDYEIRDFATRMIEPHHLTVKRFGFREPGIRCFMKNIYEGEELDTDVHYDILVPISQNAIFDKSQENVGYSPGGANTIYRVYHPNGMRWWRDNGILGCGIQWGTPSSTELGWGEIGAKGNGLTQVGIAIINFFRKNIPLDKEIVAAYLRLVPTTALSIASSNIRTAGGGLQTTHSNSPFYNVEEIDPNYAKMSTAFGQVGLLGIPEYEYKLYWKEEHQGSLAGYTYNELREFCKKKKSTEMIIGAITFPFLGSIEGAGPVSVSSGGAADSVWGFFNQYDYWGTKRGHTLYDINIEAHNKHSNVLRNFITKQRSQSWYQNFVPLFMGGVHSKTNCYGLNTRLDEDEGGSADGPEANETLEMEDTGRGYGFSCSSGGWAKDHRVIDITDQAREAYFKDRFDAKYNTVVDKKLTDLGSSYDLLKLQPTPTTNYISLGTMIATDRVIYESSADFYNNVIENGLAWGNVDVNNLNCVVLDLKQIPPPRTVEGIQIGDDTTVVASERTLRKNAIVEKIEIELEEESSLPEGEKTRIYVFSRSYDNERNRLNGWKLLFSQISEGDISISEILVPAKQIRHIKIMSNVKISSCKVYGWMTEDFASQVPMTDPAINEMHYLSRAVVEKNVDTYAGDYTIIFLEFPSTKIYNVSICPFNNSGDMSSNGFNAIAKDQGGDVALTYKGIFNYFDAPEFTWSSENENYWITEGEWAYSPSMNAVILPPIDKYVNNLKVADLRGLSVCVEYVTGRGAKARLNIQAVGTGPSYDVDPEAICEITDEGAALLGTPEVVNPLPWSVLNTQELRGGYTEGNMPTNGNGSLESLFANTESSKFWSSYCKGTVDIWGEPDQFIYGSQFIAPAFIIEKDPVSEEALSNGFSLLTDIDVSKIPNGGRIPANLVIKLYSSDGENSDYSGDQTYRKKQVGYVPELYVYLRERIPNYSYSKENESNFGLIFE